MDLSVRRWPTRSPSARPRVEQRRRATYRQHPECEVLARRTLLSSLGPAVPAASPASKGPIETEGLPAADGAALGNKLKHEVRALRADRRTGLTDARSMMSDFRTLNAEYTSIVRRASRTSPTVPGTGESTPLYLQKLLVSSLANTNLVALSLMGRRPVVRTEELEAGLQSLKVPQPKIDRFLADFQSCFDRAARSISSLVSQGAHDIQNLHDDEGRALALIQAARTTDVRIAP